MFVLGGLDGFGWVCACGFSVCGFPWVLVWLVGWVFGWLVWFSGVYLGILGLGGVGAI